MHAHTFQIWIHPIHFNTSLKAIIFLKNFNLRGFFSISRTHQLFVIVMHLANLNKLTTSETLRIWIWGYLSSLKGCEHPLMKIVERTLRSSTQIVSGFSNNHELISLTNSWFFTKREYLYAISVKTKDIVCEIYPSLVSIDKFRCFIILLSKVKYMNICEIILIYLLLFNNANSN